MAIKVLKTPFWGTLLFTRGRTPQRLPPIRGSPFPTVNSPLGLIIPEVPGGYSPQRFLEFHRKVRPLQLSHSAPLFPINVGSTTRGPLRDFFTKRYYMRLIKPHKFSPYYNPRRRKFFPRGFITTSPACHTV